MWNSPSINYSLIHVWYNNRWNWGPWGHGPPLSEVSILVPSLFARDFPQYRSLDHITDGQTGLNWLVFSGRVRKKWQQMFVSLCHIHSPSPWIQCVIFIALVVTRMLNLVPQNTLKHAILRSKNVPLPRPFTQRGGDTPSHTLCHLDSLDFGPLHGPHFNIASAAAVWYPSHY